MTNFWFACGHGFQEAILFKDQRRRFPPLTISRSCRRSSSKSPQPRLRPPHRTAMPATRVTRRCTSHLPLWIADCSAPWLQGIPASRDQARAKGMPVKDLSDPPSSVWFSQLVALFTARHCEFRLCLPAWLLHTSKLWQPAWASRGHMRLMSPPSLSRRRKLLRKLQQAADTNLRESAYPPPQQFF